MHIREFTSNAIYSCGKKHYYLNYFDSLKWINLKIKIGQISEIEYLKELLMIKSSRVKIGKMVCIFNCNGTYLGDVNQIYKQYGRRIFLRN